MYWIPLLIVALICVIGVAWSPIFAFVLAIPALLVFFGYVGFSRRADQTERGVPGDESAVPQSDSTTEGIWGERQAQPAKGVSSGGRPPPPRLSTRPTTRAVRPA